MVRAESGSILIVFLMVRYRRGTKVVVSEV